MRRKPFSGCVSTMPARLLRRQLKPGLHNCFSISCRAAGQFTHQMPCLLTLHTPCVQTHPLMNKGPWLILAVFGIQLLTETLHLKRSCLLCGGLGGRCLAHSFGDPGSSRACFEVTPRQLGTKDAFRNLMLSQLFSIGARTVHPRTTQQQHLFARTSTDAGTATQAMASTRALRRVPPLPPRRRRTTRRSSEVSIAAWDGQRSCQ